MNGTSLRKISIIISSLCLSSTAYAAEAAPDDLFSLSLEELMQVEIYTASQENETAAQSPATISVITAQQLKQWGIINLHDAISLLPGIVKSESYLGQTTQTFRGITPGLFNNKSLYLINGHPSYESLFGSTLLDYIPIEIVERLEVVRSPASVLYGTNATNGVINIITKQGAEHDSLLSLRAGSHSHRYGSIVHHRDGLSMAASVQRDNGYRYDGTQDEFGNEMDMNYHYDLNNVFIDSYGDDWRINAAFFDREKAMYGINPWVWQNGNFETYVGYLDANKTFSFERSELNLWLRYDISDKDIHVGAFPFPADTAECSALNIIPTEPCTATNPSGQTDTASTVYNTVQRYSMEVQYKEHINDQLNYIIGATYEEQTSDPLVFRYDADDSLNQPAFTGEHDTQTAAVYAQIKYQPDTDTILIAGARGESNSESGGSGLMPRLGVTRQIFPGTYAKLLYSEAFRTPMFIEKYVALTNVLQGDENLQRETIKTYEAGIESQINPGNQLQFTLYNLELENEILRFPLPNSTETIYMNGDGKTMHGVEAEWKTIFLQDYELILNATYLGGKDKSLDEDDAPFIANESMNAILTYYASKQLNMSLTAQHIGKKETLLDTGERASIDAYTLINLAATYRQKAHEVRLILNNVTDEDYSYPEPVRRKVSAIPGGAGFTSYLQYTYSF